MMSDRNAKDEFLAHTKDHVVLCATILHGRDYSEEDGETFVLPVGWQMEKYLDFLANLSFSYDAGYGGQELFGTIWYTDGTWSERGEYDGSEWWDYKACPPIPPELAAP